MKDRSDFRIYFVLSAGRGHETLFNLKRIGIRNFLISFEYAREVFKETAEVMKTIEEESSLIFDSGAFSAWTHNREVNISEYISYVKDNVLTRKFKNIYIANLDKIPSVPGTPPTSQQVKESAEISSRNADVLRAAGIEPMEIFHQGENYDFLFRMIEKVEKPYIGISPANDVSVKQRILWLDQVFGLLENRYPNTHIQTHGYGVTSFEIMRKYPWTSVDSATYRLSAAYGNITLFDPEKPGFFRYYLGTGVSSEYNRKLMRKGWKDIKKFFPPFITKPEDLSSLMMRGAVIAYSLFCAQKWINRQQELAFSQKCLSEVL